MEGINYIKNNYWQKAQQLCLIKSDQGICIVLWKENTTNIDKTFITAIGNQLTKSNKKDRRNWPTCENSKSPDCILSVQRGTNDKMYYAELTKGWRNHTELTYPVFRQCSKSNKSSACCHLNHSRIKEISLQNQKHHSAANTKDKPKIITPRASSQRTPACNVECSYNGCTGFQCNKGCSPTQTNCMFNGKYVSSISQEKHENKWCFEKHTIKVYAILLVLIVILTIGLIYQIWRIIQVIREIRHDKTKKAKISHKGAATIKASSTISRTSPKSQIGKTSLKQKMTIWMLYLLLGSKACHQATADIISNGYITKYDFKVNVPQQVCQIQDNTLGHLNSKSVRVTDTTILIMDREIDNFIVPEQEKLYQQATQNITCYSNSSKYINHPIKHEGNETLLFIIYRRIKDATTASITINLREESMNNQGRIQIINKQKVMSIPNQLQGILYLEWSNKQMTSIGLPYEIVLTTNSPSQQDSYLLHHKWFSLGKPINNVAQPVTLIQGTNKLQWDQMFIKSSFSNEREIYKNIPSNHVYQEDKLYVCNSTASKQTLRETIDWKSVQIFSIQMATRKVDVLLTKGSGRPKEQTIPALTQLYNTNKQWTNGRCDNLNKKENTTLLQKYAKK